MTRSVGRPSKEPAVLDKVRLAVEDEWPIAEIIETHNISFRTIKKYFPDYKGVPGFRRLKREHDIVFGRQAG